eukprot:4758681-Prymnesium_polylepis.1
MLRGTAGATAGVTAGVMVGVMVGVIAAGTGHRPRGALAANVSQRPLRGHTDYNTHAQPMHPPTRRSAMHARTRTRARARARTVRAGGATNDQRAPTVLTHLPAPPRPPA